MRPRIDDRNVCYFGNQNKTYAKFIAELDTYRAINHAVTNEVRNAEKLLDIGHGLVFVYETKRIPKIVALDLFVPSKNSRQPTNIKFVKGSALQIPAADGSFDTVLMNMLLHHLVSDSVSKSWQNVQQAVAEGFRVLRPGGKLVIVESCVPNWFFFIERAVFPLFTAIVSRFLVHPMAFQYRIDMLKNLVSFYDPGVVVKRIPKGRWLLQFGFKFPSALTPIAPFILTARKIRV